MCNNCKNTSEQSLYDLVTKVEIIFQVKIILNNSYTYILLNLENLLSLFSCFM